MKQMRIDKIESYLQQKKTATTVDLCERFNVSLNTIRRDINLLCKQGVIKKVYGGVVLTGDSQVIPYSARSASEIDEKIIIAELASKFLQAGDTIYLDSGSTTAYLLDYIRPEMNITIISNSLNVYIKAQNIPQLNMISLGGIYNRKTNSFVGNSAITVLREYRVNKAFMGLSGFTSEGGAANNSYHEAEIKRMVIKQSNKVILMADSTKFDKTASICFCATNEINTFITDKEPNEKYVDLFKANGITLLYKQ